VRFRKEYTSSTEIKPEWPSSEGVSAHRTKSYSVSNAGKKLMPLAQLRDSSAGCAALKVQMFKVRAPRILSFESSEDGDKVFTAFRTDFDLLNC
jgi:hypothetical protein